MAKKTTLTGQEWRVIELCFIPYGGKYLTHDEAAGVMGISRQRISAIVKSIKAKFPMAFAEITKVKSHDVMTLDPIDIDSIDEGDIVRKF